MTPDIHRPFIGVLTYSDTISNKSTCATITTPTVGHINRIHVGKSIET